MLEEAGLEELGPLTAVDPSIALPAVPAQKTAAEPATAGAVAAPPPEPAADTPVEAPPAVNPEPDAPPAPDVVQTAPTNVNISVRIDSPGDNGSVEQLNVAASTGGAVAAAAPSARPPLSISRMRRSISSRYRLRPPPQPIPRRSRPRQSRHSPLTAGPGIGTGIAVMQSLTFHFRRRSERRNGPGTGIGIAEMQIQYLGILAEKTRRSINPVLRSIGRSISTSRYASTVRVTTGQSRSRTSQSSSRRPHCRRFASRYPFCPSVRFRASPAPPRPWRHSPRWPRSWTKSALIRPKRLAPTTNAAPRMSPGAVSRAPPRSRKACSCRRRHRRMGLISPPASASGHPLRSRSGSRRPRRPPRERRAPPRSRRSSVRRRRLPPVRSASRPLCSVPPASLL